MGETIPVPAQTSPYSQPLITQKPAVVVGRDRSLLQIETLGSNTCGFFMLSKDALSITRTRICDDKSSSCAASGNYLGCGEKPYTTCFNSKEPACGSSGKLGERTLCCQRTRGLSGECQIFVRDDGALGEKTLLGCREYDVEWDLTVSLKTATDQFSKSSTTVPTSSLPPDTLNVLAPSILTPLVSSTAITTPTSSTGSDESTSPHTGVIIGGVLGSLAILAVAGCVAVWLVVRRRRASASASTRRSDGHVSPSPGHELPGDQPCVPLKEGNEEQGNYTDLSPASTSGDVYQAPVSDAVGSSTKPAELG
ncbi:hypothetical protein CH063_07027 [Colletotrichum higginsianum]|uniref:Uncharacterized protein n=2 Tax=Colletotrichum higginsianum TaxID=80884 RepID=H1V4L4_COLHI|nr:hypothetical protein CH35J_003746 [Colletotrichum higginsianum]CCF35166.1 hypothetical protein CH063_07027 [Colletotrichum higginsianum]